MASLISTVNVDEVIDRIAKGEYQSHIARELGLQPQNLHVLVSKHPRYRQALLARNIAKLDDSQANIENESHDLARATQAFKAAAWRAERECPEEYGKDSAAVTINLHVAQLDGQAADLLDKIRTIEGEVVSDAAHQPAQKTGNSE